MKPGRDGKRMSDPVTFAIDRFLENNAEYLKLVGRAEGTWDVMVPSYWREAIALSVTLGSADLRCEGFFLRAPDERRDDAYALLLRKNVRSHVWKFATNDVGDVSLVCELPRSAVDAGELDRLFGSLITIVDETYVAYMKIAFGSAIDDQVKRGGPGLDRPPWAGDWGRSADSASGK